MARDAGALIRSLVALRAERRTGVLDVTADGVRTSIFLMEGSVIFAEEDPGSETLGRLLVRQGMLTNDQYASAIQIMADALAEEEQLRFGQVVVDLGFITADQLHDALTEQARSRLVRAFQRGDHEWRLDDRRERVDGVPLYDLAIEPLVVLAVRSSPDEDLQDDAVPPALAASMGRVPVLSGDPKMIAYSFQLGPTESAYVATIDGTKSIADCLRMGPSMVDRAAILTALLLTRAIKLTDRSAAAGDEPPPSSRSPEPPASQRIVTAPAAPPPSMPLPAANAQAVAAGVAKAKHASRLNAELAFQKGKNLLRAGRVEGALEEFRRAFALDPLPEFELYARWIDADANKRPLIDSQRASLQTLALAVSRQDPNNAFAAFVIGRIAALEGRETDSKRWLERAYRFDPKLREAHGAPAAADNADAPPSSSRLLGWLRRDKE